MAYGRDRVTRAAAPAQYEQFQTNVNPRAYLSKPEVDRYNEQYSKYQTASSRRYRGAQQHRQEAAAGLSGLYSQAQSNAMQQYADYRERIGSGSTKGTVLGKGDQLVSDPTGWELPNQQPGPAQPYFGPQSQMSSWRPLSQRGRRQGWKPRSRGWSRQDFGGMSGGGPGGQSFGGAF